MEAGDSRISGKETGSEVGYCKPPVATRFQPGNPGRAKGSRNKLSEQFVADILADWEQHGIEVIQKVRENKPTEYLKVVAGVITKDVAVTVRDYDDLTDDQLAAQFEAVAARLVGGDATGGRGRAARKPGSLPH